MFKMILADDEPVITRGIQKLLDWKALGIEIVGAYEDGKAAFEGILLHKPELALLDIYMPKKTGIEVLQELKQLGIGTKVIFISGFQDFEYARAALQYGAEGYLLKPVLREELIGTIERCTLSLRNEHPQMPETAGHQAEQILPEGTAYERLLEMEDCVYRTAIAGILPPKPLSRQEKKLMQFSVLSFLEGYLEAHNLGIVFIKHDRLVMVLKERQQAETGQLLYELMAEAERILNIRLGLIGGRAVGAMGEIPKAYEDCLSMEGYFYFAGQMKLPVFWTGDSVYRKPVSLTELDGIRNAFIECLLVQDEEEFLRYRQKLSQGICVAADGRKDDACFQYGTTVRAIEERYSSMGIAGIGADLKELLEQARNTESYEQLNDVFTPCFEQYYAQIRNSVMTNDRREINLAKEYIEQHYRENLTLEVLSGVVHMNPYYFSAFFKKSSGQNFKDYLNQVRMRHAVAMLVSTDKRAAEIADEVGFRDGRSFSELFQRYYGETPSNYRKRLKD